MLFDQFAGIIEKYLPDFNPDFADTSIFDFKEINQPPPEDLNTLKEQMDLFIFPFDNVTVETDYCCCLLGDLETEKVGLEKEIVFILYIKSLIKKDNKITENWSISNGVICNIKAIRMEKAAKGRYKIAQDGTLYGYKFGISVVYQAKIMKKGIESIEGTNKQQISQLIGGYIVDIIEKLIFLNNPNRFIVEVIPTKMRKCNKKRIRRSPDRSQYTLLTVTDIQKRYGLGKAESKGTGKSPVPHPRRRHYRTLRSDKFTHKKGKKILIPATWVGKSEIQKGNKIYKVRFDI